MNHLHIHLLLPYVLSVKCITGRSVRSYLEQKQRYERSTGIPATTAILYRLIHQPYPDKAPTLLRPLLLYKCTAEQPNAPQPAHLHYLKSKIKKIRKEYCHA